MHARYYSIEYDRGPVRTKEECANKVTLSRSKNVGVQYLLGAVKKSGKDAESLLSMIARIHKKSKWKNLTEREERLYNAMERILVQLKNYVPFSIPFLVKVSKKEVPDYYTLIANPMDLGKVGKKLNMQAYKEGREFCEDLDLIWENCFRYNNAHGNIYAMYAQRMKEKAETLIRELEFDQAGEEIAGTEEEQRYFRSTEKERLEFACRRKAVLATPREFTKQRDAKEMGSFWKREMEEGKAHVPGEVGLADKQTGGRREGEAYFIPEYLYFYNSFPVDYMEQIKMTRELLVYDVDEIHFVFQDYYKAVLRNEKVKYLEDRRHLEYDRDGYTLIGGARISKVSGDERELRIGREEVYGIMKKFISLDMVRIGFTGTEGRAMDVVVSYITISMHEIARKVREMADEHMKECEFEKEGGNRSEDTIMYGGFFVKGVVRRVLDQYSVKDVHAWQGPRFNDEGNDRTESGDEAFLGMLESEAEAEEIDPMEELI